MIDIFYRVNLVHFTYATVESSLHMFNLCEFNERSKVNQSLKQLLAWLLGTILYS